MPFVYYPLYFIVFYDHLHLPLWVSHSNWWQHAEMYAERIELWCAMVHTHITLKKWNISENWLCSVHVYPPPLLFATVFLHLFTASHTDKRMNYWICVRAISSDNVSWHNKNWRVFVSQFSHHFHSNLLFLRVFFFLLIFFTEKWVLFVLYFPLNALNKRGKVRDQNTCTHARTSTLTHEFENKCENIK